MAHWARICGDPSSIQTILFDGQVAGSVSSYVEEPGKPEVTYWLGKEFWGQGIGTRALAAFLGQMTERPVYARAAKDNAASLRVLEERPALPSLAKAKGLPTRAAWRSRNTS